MKSVIETKNDPRYFGVSFVHVPRPILSHRQARRMQVFPIGVTYLPEEAEGDDWDIKLENERAFPKPPEFFDPSSVVTPADRRHP